MHIRMSRKCSGVGEGWIQAGSDLSVAIGPGRGGSMQVISRVESLVYFELHGKETKKWLSVVQQVNRVCFIKYNKANLLALYSSPHLSYPGVPDVLGVEELGAVKHGYFCSWRKTNKGGRETG